MAGVSFKPPELRYKESKESFKKRVEQWERSSGKAFKDSGPNNAEGLKILSGGGSLRIGNKDFSTDADWKDELKEISTYRASKGRSPKQQLKDKEELQKNLEYETERQRENFNPKKVELGKVRDQAHMDAVYKASQRRYIQDMSKADRRAYDNKMLERKHGLQVGSLSGTPKELHQGYDVGSIRGTTPNRGKLESQTLGFLQRNREAQTEATNQIVRGNNDAYNVAQTPRTAGKWSGNIHSSARNSVAANNMRIQEQFQGQGANMGYRQAEQAAKQQADAAAQGAKNVAKGQKGGEAPGSVPGAQQPPEVQKPPEVQEPIEPKPKPPKESLKTGKADGAKGGPGAMAYADAALEVAKLLSKKKEGPIVTKEGRGPGSTGMDWYNANWYA